jgi:hypothetical protein
MRIGLITLLLLMPYSHADGNCDRGTWTLQLDASSSALSHDEQASFWRDGVLSTDGRTYQIDLGGDGEADVTAEDIAFAVGPRQLLIAGCAQPVCGQPMYAPDWQVTSAMRDDLVGGTLTVSRQTATLSFSTPGGDVRVVWQVGEWISDKTP